MQGGKAIIEAVKAGRLAEVQRLIKQQPELIAHGTENGVPITLLAAYYRQQEVFEWLMQQREKPTIYEAVVAGQIDQVRDLLEENAAWVNAFSPDGYTPLGLACYFNQDEIAQFLIDRGANVTRAATHGSKVTPLHSAVAANNTSLCRLLLEHGADVNARQTGGITALQSAAHRGNVELVQLLLDQGADPSLRTDDGLTALDYARQDQHDDVISLLE